MDSDNRSLVWFAACRFVTYALSHSAFNAQWFRWNRLPILELLLQEGANPKIADHEGVTPLMAACRNNNVEACFRLINKGCEYGRGFSHSCYLNMSNVRREGQVQPTCPFAGRHHSWRYQCEGDENALIFLSSSVWKDHTDNTCLWYAVLHQVLMCFHLIISSLAESTFDALSFGKRRWPEHSMSQGANSIDSCYTDQSTWKLANVTSRCAVVVLNVSDFSCWCSTMQIRPFGTARDVQLLTMRSWTYLIDPQLDPTHVYRSLSTRIGLWPTI